MESEKSQKTVASVMAVTFRQALMFTIAWLSYSSTYFLRKPLSVVKTDLETEVGLTRWQLGLLDTALLLPYATAQVLLSGVVDRFPARITHSLSLLAAAVSMVSFGWYDSFPVLVILLTLNGASQALCWPAVSKVMNQWFSGEIRNTVFGLLSTSAFAGGILGTTFAVYANMWVGWRSVHTCASMVVGSASFLVYALFREKHSESSEAGSNTARNSSRLAYSAIWRLPAVPEISCAMFCVKLVRYSLMMWLPMYLSGHLSYSRVTAGMLSVSFEAGGVVGSIVLAYILDRYCENQTVMGTGVMVMLSATSLILFTLTATSGILLNTVWLALAGAFNCATDAILGGSIPMEIAEKSGISSGGAVVGFVNGMGSFGAVLQGVAVGFLSQAVGWDGVFYWIIILNALGAVAVFRAAALFNQKVTTIVI